MGKRSIEIFCSQLWIYIFYRNWTSPTDLRYASFWTSRRQKCWKWRICLRHPRYPVTFPPTRSSKSEFRVPAILSAAAYTTFVELLCRPTKTRKKLMTWQIPRLKSKVGGVSASSMDPSRCPAFFCIFHLTFYLNAAANFLRRMISAATCALPKVP